MGISSVFQLCGGFLVDLSPRFSSQTLEVRAMETITEWTQRTKLLLFFINQVGVGGKVGILESFKREELQINNMITFNRLLGV